MLCSAKVAQTSSGNDNDTSSLDQLSIYHSSKPSRPSRPVGLLKRSFSKDLYTKMLTSSSLDVGIRGGVYFLLYFYNVAIII